MLRLVVIGAGAHSAGNHLPALAQYAAEHPGAVQLAALCDLQRERAAEMAARFGFARVYTDLDEMLAREEPDGCIAVTPIPVTAEIAARVIGAGVPLCMEKPPGATMAEAREVARLAAQPGARVMVSVNRRFDPALRAALFWQGERRIECLRATIARVNRREPDFMTGTAIHALDAMRYIAGYVRDLTAERRVVDGVRWYGVTLHFTSGALGWLEVWPSCGSAVEAYEWCGAGYRVVARTGTYDDGTAQGWQGGECVWEFASPPGTPEYVRNGAYGEVVEFVAALQEGRAPYPSPAAVLQSVELCHAISGDY